MNENQKASKSRDVEFVEKTTLVSLKGAAVTVQRLTLSKHGARVLTSSSRGIRSGTVESAKRKFDAEMA